MCQQYSPGTDLTCLGVGELRPSSGPKLFFVNELRRGDAALSAWHLLCKDSSSDVKAFNVTLMAVACLVRGLK
jgi:hypothetical protein